MRDRNLEGFTTLPAAGAVEVGAFRLFTATLAITDGEGVLELVHACRAGGVGEVRSRLCARIGPSLAAMATVRPGIDPSDPIVSALLGADIVRTLSATGDLHGHALSGGGALVVMQRRS